MENRNAKEIKKETKEKIKRLKKLKKKKKWPFIVTISLIIIIGIVISCFTLLKKEDKIEPKKEKKEDIKEVTTSVSMVMVGDNLIHSSVYKDAYRLAGNKGYDFKPIISYIKEKTKDYDIAYYNQETILGGTELGLSDYPTFNSPFEAGDAMIDAGFNLVSLATNHTMDSGSKAVLSSRDYWNKQKDVLAVGSYSSEEEKEEIKIMTKNDITYTMLNYTYGTNGIAVPNGKEYLVNVWPTNLSINDPVRDTKYQNYKENVKKDIEKVRDKVDVLIVAMHWGIEYTHEPTAYEKDMANYLASLGVDIIIGTHPHVIQPITYIDDTVVFYSLGNFLSAQLQDENYNKTVELMGSLNITKTKKGDKVSIKIDNVKAELLYNYYNKSTWRSFKVIPFSNPDISKYLSNYKQVYEKYKNIVQKYNDIEVVPAA